MNTTERKRFNVRLFLKAAQVDPIAAGEGEGDAAGITEHAHQMTNAEFQKEYQGRMQEYRNQQFPNWDQLSEEQKQEAKNTVLKQKRQELNQELRSEYNTMADNRTTNFQNTYLQRYGVNATGVEDSQARRGLVRANTATQDKARSALTQRHVTPMFGEGEYAPGSAAVASAGGGSNMGGGALVSATGDIGNPAAQPKNTNNMDYEIKDPFAAGNNYLGRDSTGRT